MNEGRRTLVTVVSATVGLGVMLGVRPLPTERILAIYVLTLAAIALLHLVRVFRGELQPAGSSRFELGLRDRARRKDQRPLVLFALERDIELSVTHAGHAHRRLVPLLRAAATARLQTNHALELERSGEAARRLLGDEAWEFLRPDRPPPPDPFGPGPSRETITAVIERVEAL